MQLADLAALPSSERLAAMEALWDLLSHDPGYDPSPAWHADVLAQRRHEMAQGATLPWEEVKARLRVLAGEKPH